MEEGGKASSWDMWIPFGKEKGDGPPKGPSEPWGRVESHLFRLAMTLKETEVGVQREWRDLEGNYSVWKEKDHVSALSST
jgi:hypothetical protein